MKTFFGELALKEELLRRLRQHQAADQVMQGKYWEKVGGDFRGCFIGCAIHGEDPMKFEHQFGISVYVARLGEHFFENSPAEQAKRMPVEIIEAVPVEVDSSLVWPRFWSWLLHNPTTGLLHQPLDQSLLVLLKKVEDLYATRPQIDKSAAWSALSAAIAAEYAARSAAISAKYAAISAKYAGFAAIEAQYQAFLSILRGLNGGVVEASEVSSEQHFRAMRKEMRMIP